MKYRTLISLKCFLFPALWIPLIFCAACNESGAEQNGQRPESLRAEMEPTEVAVDTVRQEIFTERIEAIGKISSGSQATVIAATGGNIRKVNFRNGDRVRRGVLLMVLDNEREKLSMEKAEIELKERRSDFEGSLVGYLDENLSDTILQNLRISSGLPAAEIALKSAQLDYRNTLIRSPIAGTISGLKVHAGQAIQAGEELAFIYDQNQMVVNCQVTGTQALKIKRGMPAHITLSEGEEFSARVNWINPRTNEENGLVELQLSIASPPSDLIHGLPVNVVVEIPHQESLLVPVEAVVDRNGRDVIFTLEDGKAIWKYVTVGRSNGEEVEIIEGLQKGELVIIRNNLQLGHEARVRIKTD